MTKIIANAVTFMKFIITIIGIHGMNEPFGLNTLVLCRIVNASQDKKQCNNNTLSKHQIKYDQVFFYNVSYAACLDTIKIKRSIELFTW